MIVILSDWDSPPPPPFDELGRVDEGDPEVVERDDDRVFEIVGEERSLSELVLIVFVGVGVVRAGELAGFAFIEAVEEVSMTVFAVVADGKSVLCQRMGTPNP
jgi:hypothetical protein